ncbi:MAG: homoserine dehydrogenase [Firmicutes bacterium]|nr:homoserine dehydrogenase [Bacillota bacterium]
MGDLKLALLGFGSVGQAFSKMLTEKQDDIRKTYGRGVIVTAISGRSKGTIVDPDGIDLMKVCADVEATGAFDPETKGYCDKNTMEVVAEADYDAICEMTVLNIFTGQPAIDHIKGAFARGKHVVTANKGPIAWAFDELKQEADEKGLGFFYETTVMDGTPVFNLVEHTLKLCKVTAVSGILNSTTNFILEGLAAGTDYDTIMEEGRRLGFVEADPTMDTHGYDAAAKVTALLNVLMHAGITPEDVDRKGIEDITVEDIKAAEARGKVIKLLCEGRLEDEKVIASVKPVEVDKQDMMASVDSTTSVVSITTDLMGKVSVIEHAPEIEQTAYGVFGDVLRVLEV